MRNAVSTLSGGNQQKVVLGKWLARSPSLLIIDEPTRGIDVGTKAEVHRLLDGLVAEGLAVLMISSELPEVLGMADRVLVLREGRITAEFTRAEAERELHHARGDRAEPGGSSMKRAKGRGAAWTEEQSVSERRGAVPPGLRSEERATREGGAPSARQASGRQSMSTAVITPTPTARPRRLESLLRARELGIALAIIVASAHDP